MLPRLERHYGKLPEVLPAEGKKRARVALFTGCASDAFFPSTNLATARVLQRNGCDVVIPRAQVCCGALHYHAALEEPAQQFARSNLTAFSAPVDAVIVNAAGCGALLKDYGHLLHATPHAPAAAAFARKVRDISEFLVELGPVKPEHPLPIKATYHDACHLCHGQQIRKQPRQLLEMIPGLDLVPLAESELCCGAAGSYNLTQPEMAERLGQRKAKNLLDTGAQAVFTANAGCLIQIGRYLRAQRPDIWVAHPIDALWASYSGSGVGRSR
jgi:glycolate oxidase iron-sulfur subunit